MEYRRLPRRIFIVILFWMIGSVVTLTSTPQRNSGIYVDNGSEQTVIHRLTTDEERLALEREILKLLGLPYKPKTTNGPAPLIKRSAPKFLLNVYENSLKNVYNHKRNRSEELAEFYFSSQDLRIIDESDVIISFTAHQNHKGAGGKPDRVKRIWFDVDAVPPDDQMTSAELRLYRGPDAKNRKNRGAFTITVYRVLRTKDGEREMQLVDMVNTTTGQRGWITLNVTESLRHWLKYPNDNKGFYLSVYPIDRSSHETRPEDIGIVGFKGDAERQPFMAGFFRSTESSRSRLIQPTLMSIEEGIKRNQKRYTSDVRDLLKDHYTDKVGRYSTRSCKIQNLYVSFKDLQWQDWIIAPNGYDAYYCNGECKFPLNTHVNATNHAIVQTLVHLLHPRKIPKPCCAPTELSAISVLYFLDENNVALKKYNNMVVRGCGCH